MLEGTCVFFYFSGDREVFPEAICQVNMSVFLQEGAVGSVCVSGLVRFADSDSSGEPGTRSTGWHLLQHTHTAVDIQYGGYTPSAQKGEWMFGHVDAEADTTEAIKAYSES